MDLLERRRIEASVLVPLIRAFQAEFGEERTNEVVGRTIRELARAQGEADRKNQQVRTMEDLANRAGNGVLKEGSLIVDVVEQTPERYGFNVTACKFVQCTRSSGRATSARCSPAAATSPTSRGSRPMSPSNARRRGWKVRIGVTFGLSGNKRSR